ncbi:ABC transporter ATP-binding protein/permease [Levilactobacillus bambusae]|uniref:ABC transporter ATP-binding protein n=1 Tax=Levilactobacillus bambusae TaxID=2024736 RepID=A0A2V1N254_9LACO|nr:ABC transporter ATP-binding protein/permease [Levilactobacillus bambusae]PWG00300.1 ABC transporter ATP-binding protein [Levilactobacillus bambusae]
MAFLEVRDVYKSYYLGKEEFPVLKGISLDFNLGEFVSILGESGGGKSTLMNIIGGLDRNFKGSILVDGKKLDHTNEKDMDRYRRETIGYIYQSYNLISHLTVLDNVLISLDMTSLSGEAKKTRAKELLAEVGLTGQEKKYPNQLSGGQKQRVAIARALASNPKVIIADEPTGALDSQNTKEVLEILNRIASEGRLVITVTHSQDVADSGTRIVKLVDGKIASDEQVREPYVVDTKDPGFKSRLLPASVSYRTAWKHFKYNFGRNFLIVLGTAIGLFAVILFSGLGNGISGYINKQITDVANPKVISVSRYQKKSDNDQQGGAGMMQQASLTKVPTFDTKQINKLKDLDHVDKVEKMYTANSVTVKRDGKSASISNLTNWTALYPKSSIEAGHAPKKGEVLLDKTSVAKKLDKQDWKALIGKTVTLSYKAQSKSGQIVTVKFNAKVSGIGKNQTGASAVNGVNTETLADAMKAKNVDTNPQAMIVSVNTLDNAKTVSKQINKIKIDGKRQFTSTSIASMIDTVQTYIHLASTILAVIAAISLVVSALMIIVTMYMSVSARTKEIGVLRALGESKKDIRRLFVSESLIMGVLSAVLATALAYGVGAGANALLAKIASYSFIQITAGDVITTFVIAIVISLLAAVLPARHASKLNPIDALAAD